MEVSGDYFKGPTSLGHLPHFSFLFFSLFIFFSLNAYTVLLMIHPWKREMARTCVGPGPAPVTGPAPLIP